MAPALLFDKSFLESLNLDEAVLLDHLFFCTVTPLFFAETIGSLSKDADNGRVPEKIVASLAQKTPVARSYMSAFHLKLIHAELHGMEVEMRNRPPIDGGIPVRVDGEDSLVYKKSAETEAFERWQRGLFSDVEMVVSQQWREHLDGLGLPDIAAAVKQGFKGYRVPKSYLDARSIASEVVTQEGQNYRNLILAMDIFGIGPRDRSSILSNWKSAQRPALQEYAPYTSFCLEIELFFYLAMSNGIISDQRPSHKIDISYLFYLPFCHVFASVDKLHRATAPLFMRNRQLFVWGPDLKSDLKALNARFLAYPEDQKAKGLLHMVTEPPRDHVGTVVDLWDHTQPDWREVKRSSAPSLDPEKARALIERGNKIQAAAKRLDAGAVRLAPVGKNSSIMINRAIPRQRGSWTIIPPTVG